MFNKETFLGKLKTANIDAEIGATGKYKGDHYVSAGDKTPHIHVSKAGLFVGLKGKRGAITTLVYEGKFKPDSIISSIEDLKDSSAPNDMSITQALRLLGQMEKAERKAESQKKK